MCNRDPEWDKAVAAFRAGDKRGALFVFRKIAHRGYGAAYLEIGNILELGGDGVESDIDEAIVWYRKSVDEMDEPKARLALGRIFLRRRRSDEEMNEALLQLSRLPEEPGALFGLGMMYDFGWGVKQDRTQAIEHYRQSMKLGHIMAKKRYAELNIRSGRVLSGILLWIRSSIEVFRLLSSNPEDRRLRVA